MKKALFTTIIISSLAISLASCGHEHVFSEWKTVKEATCTSEGLKERACECGEIETETISSEGHDYEEKVIKDKTCTENGEIEKNCKICKNKETEVISSTGHDFTEATIYAPKICKICGNKEGEALSKSISVGEEIKSEGNHSFVVENVTFTGSLSEKKGSTTYKSSYNYACAIKLKFTNLSTDAFERWNSERISDVKMLYQGKYNYEGDYWCPVDDIVALGNGNVYIVYEVPQSMGEDKESAIYTSFKIDEQIYSLIIQDGKILSDDVAAKDKNTNNIESSIKVGDVRSDGEKFSFEVKDVYFTSNLNEKRGSTTYNYQDGFYLVVKLDLKNLSEESFKEHNSSRVSDVKVKFDGKYDYEGNYWCPGNDIVPLGNGNVYIICNIAETVENSDAPLVVSFKIDGKEFNIDCRAAK